MPPHHAQTPLEPNTRTRNPRKLRKVITEATRKLVEVAAEASRNLAELVTSTLLDVLPHLHERLEDHVLLALERQQRLGQPLSGLLQKLQALLCASSLASRCSSAGGTVDARRWATTPWATATSSSIRTRLRSSG